MISVQGATIIYDQKRGQRNVVFEDLNVEVGDGEFLSIVGPSGCGKSTLLLGIAGLVPLSAGQIVVGDRKVDGPSADVGFVFQQPVLFDWRTVLENVLVPIRVLRGDISAARQRAESLLEMVGLSDAKEKYPFELSGGMQQRTSIARALIHNPPTLLMDEPFGALDALSREQLNLDLQEIWQNERKTVVFVTHSIEEAVFLGDQVVVLGGKPATVRDTVRVELERPRDLDVVTTPEFGELTKRLRAALG